MKSLHCALLALALLSAARADVSAQSNVSELFSLPAPLVTPAAYAETMQRLIVDDSVHTWHLAVNGHMVMQHDSTRRLTDSLIRHWVTSVRTQPISHLQQVPMLNLEARAGDLAAVQQHVTTLLAAPHRSDEERIWILDSAIRGLMAAGGATVGDTVPSAAAFQLARTYEKTLARMSSGAAGDLARATRVGALMMFMGRAWADHDVAQAVRDGWQAYAVLAAIPSYEVRAQMVGSPTQVLPQVRPSHLDFAALLAGQPQNRAALDSLTRLLERALVLPPALAAQDPSLQQLEQDMRESLSGMMQVISMYGRPAPPLVATHWFNQAIPGALAPAELAGATGSAVRLKPMNDGHIHIIVFGFYACPAGKEAAQALQRLLPTLPRSVDAQYYVTTNGSWGGELVDPDVEAEHLRRYYMEYYKLTFPVAVWAGKKIPTPDEGMLPETSPVAQALHFSICPTIVVVDGRGMVRFYKIGSSAIDQLRGVVTLLDGERTQGAGSSSASVLSSMTSMSTSTNVGVPHS